MMSSATKGAEIVLLKLLVLAIAILVIYNVACFKLSFEGVGVCQLHQSSWKEPPTALTMPEHD